MNAPALSDDFYASLPLFRDFTHVMDPSLFKPLPGDWMVGVADVVQSTKAIAENRYKAVNMAGAARHSARPVGPVVPLRGNPRLTRRRAVVGGRARARRECG